MCNVHILKNDLLGLTHSPPHCEKAQILHADYSAGGGGGGGAQDFCTVQYKGDK